MRLARFVPPVVALLVGTVLAVVVAILAANEVEDRSRRDVTRILGLNGFGWTEVHTDGLQVVLAGTAPDEAARFGALRAAGTVVEASRVIDMMNVTVPEPVRPPRFSVEILRNDAGISLIGLIPAAMDRETVVDRVREIAGGAEVADLLNVSDFPPPEGWDSAMSFGLAALEALPRSKISIAADGVGLRAISGSEAEKSRLEAELSRLAPPGLPLEIEITAPRPVITPYTMRFVIDDAGARFDACSTDTDAGAERIIAAAREAGLTQDGAACTIGLGIPSPNWDDAVITAIAALRELGGGSVSFSDADVTLIAPATTGQSLFDRVIGQLEADLPEVFSLHAVLPEPPPDDDTAGGEEAAQFIATKSPEGLVQLRGRIADERTRIATESLARAQFGSEAVSGAMRIDPGLPTGWSARVMASLEALSRLNNGSVVMQADLVEIRGKTGDPEAKAEIARLLAEKLGQSEDYRIDVTYEEVLDPQASIPTPEECIARITGVLAEQQITFAPSSTDIDAAALGSIERIADIVRECPDAYMEVGGHTDSQGREIMNQALSQGRAEAVIDALLARRVLTSNLVAVGYGETQPIADNDTEEGREKNRRIEFRLLTADEFSVAKARRLAAEEQADGEEPHDDGAEETPPEEPAPEPHDDGPANQ